MRRYREAAGLRDLRASGQGDLREAQRICFPGSEQGTDIDEAQLAPGPGRPVVLEA